MQAWIQAASTSAGKPSDFGGVSEALMAASYVEQLLAAEQQWITNRLSWLFASQSFCLIAFIIIATSTAVRFPSLPLIDLLRFGLPPFGFVCCAAVGLSVRAASATSTELANERARLTQFVNSRTPATISLIGARPELRDQRWTLWAGKLPEHLPWVLALVWIGLFVGEL